MFRRKRKSFLAVLPLVFAVVALLGPARAAEAAPLGGESARLAWRWFTTAWGLETSSCDLGPAIDPNGRCLQARVRKTSSCDLGPMVDPNGRCLQTRAQETLSCDHGSMIDPDGRCLQSPGGPLG